MKKSLNTLTVGDLHAVPYWCPADDFEDELLEVLPCTDDSLDLTSSRILAVDITLADGSVHSGYVRLAGTNLVEIAIATSEDQFIQCVIDPEIPRVKDQAGAANALEKDVDEVFPFQVRARTRLLLKAWIA